MRRGSYPLQGLIVASLCLLISSAASAQFPSALQIFLPNGGIPQRAIRLTLVREDTGLPEIVFTDTNGKYRLPTPKTQIVNYIVTIEGDGQVFATTTQSFRLDRSIPNQMNIFLKPIVSEKSSGAAVIDAANLDANVPEKARTAYKRAMVAVESGKYTAAISDLDEAIHVYPHYVTALNDLGVVYLKLNEFQRAAENFRKALEIDSRFFHGRLNLGIALTKMGQYPEAVEILKTVYEENHGMLEVRLAYGKALRGAGNLLEAEKI